MRVLFTSSRDYSDPAPIRTELEKLAHSNVVIHGGAHGATRFLANQLLPSRLETVHDVLSTIHIGQLRLGAATQL